LVEVGTFQFSERVGHFEHKFQVEGDVAPNQCLLQKTRVFLLPRSEYHVILSSFVWIGYQRVTDRQSDGQTDGIVVASTAFCIASNAAAL